MDGGVADTAVCAAVQHNARARTLSGPAAVRNVSRGASAHGGYYPGPVRPRLALSLSFGFRIPDLILGLILSDSIAIYIAAYSAACGAGGGAADRGTRATLGRFALFPRAPLVWVFPLQFFILYSLLSWLNQRTQVRVARAHLTVLAVRESALAWALARELGQHRVHLAHLDIEPPDVSMDA